MYFTSGRHWAALFDALHMTGDLAVIIAARTPILARAAMSPQHGIDPEILAMASEKVVALLEGAVAAQQGMLRLAASALTGESLQTLLRRTEAIGLAASRPARRRVRANARRLRATL
ncbi:MAG: hypothetical protein JO172_05975 [Hyphomicrobiales bacterium]|nr:hypothetical protein [Hyphomicrobiales bacterium]